MSIRIRSHAVAVAAVALFTMASGAALAQGPHHGHAPHGDITTAIVAVKDKLNLNTSQQTMWDSAVAQTKAARQTARTNFGRIKTSLDAELAKTEPDLAAVAAVSDDVQAANMALRKQVRSTWLSLYGTFGPDQKAVVRDALVQRQAKMEQFRQRMKERRGS